MRTLHVDTQTQVDSKAPLVFTMILFDLPSGLWGFWDGPGTLQWNSIDFVPGNVLQIDFGDDATGTESNSFSIRLYENPDAGLPATVLYSFLSQTYHVQPVTIYQAWFDPETLAMAGDPEIIRRGLISTVDKGFDGTGHFVLGTCETQSIRHTRRGWAKASHSEQQAVSAGDKFFEYTGIVGTVQMPFGRKLDGSAVVTPPKTPVI